MMATIDATTPIYEGLTTSDDHLRTIPVLATIVPSVENGLVKQVGKGMVVTWPLRHGVKWQDGAPFTSADVKFTEDVIMAKNTAVTTKQGFDKITKIECPDPYTVIMTYKEIYAPYNLQFGIILPKHLLASYIKDPNGDSINHAPYNRHPIGTGPFKFSEWVSGDHITLTRFDDYWQGKPKVAALKMRIVPDENAAFTLLKSGDLDIYQSANINQYDALKKLKHVEVLNEPSLSWELVAFNLKRPILQDLNLRRAIAFAIDKNQISDKIYQGLYPPAYSDQAPSSWAYNKQVENKYPFDPAKANQLLDQAGWKIGMDGIRVKDGKRLSLRIATTAGRKPRELTEQVLKYYLKKIGIELTIDNVPGSILFGPPPGGILKGGNYDLALYAWQAAPDPDGFSLWDSSQVPPNGQNNEFFKNKEMDMLEETGTKVLKRADRRKIYLRTQEILADQLPMIPLLYWANLNPINKRILNFKPNPSSAGNLWNCFDWAIAPASSAGKE
jgi:peptide/nickel transport system substrate-binding protein